MVLKRIPAWIQLEAAFSVHTHLSSLRCKTILRCHRYLNLVSQRSALHDLQETCCCVCMWAQNSKFSGKADRVACCQDHRITTYNFLKQLFYISQLHARLHLDRMPLSVSHVSLYTVTGAFMAVFSGSERCPLKCHVSSW